MKRFAFLALCLGFAALFAGLGVWQIERLQWKTALIDRLETHLAAPPTLPPAASAWTSDDAYARVRVEGVFLHEHETLVQAVTQLGPGWWVMTPLRTENDLVLINRGFVPNERRAPSARASGQIEGKVVITGLLRASEPHGGFLRTNAPAQERWYSRDVAAIARARGASSDVAPYFVDADATPNPGGYPIGGLTVVSFRNPHLGYAITWFVLCLVAVAGAVRIGGSAARPVRSEGGS